MQLYDDLIFLVRDEEKAIESKEDLNQIMQVAKTFQSLTQKAHHVVETGADLMRLTVPKKVEVKKQKQP